MKKKQETGALKPFFVCLSSQLSIDFNNSEALNYKADIAKDGYYLVYANSKEKAAQTFVINLFNLKGKKLEPPALIALYSLLFSDCILGNYTNIEKCFADPQMAEFAKAAGEDYFRKHPEKYKKSSDENVRQLLDGIDIFDCYGELIENITAEKINEYSSNYERTKYLIEAIKSTVAVIEIEKTISQGP